MIFSSKKSTVSYYSSIGTVVFSLRLCSNSWQRLFCHYKYANQQHAGWTLDVACKLSLNIVLSRLSSSSKVQFHQKTIWTGDSRTTIVPSNLLRFLHYTCSSSSLQILARRNQRSSRCYCTFIQRYLHITFQYLQCIELQVIQCFVISYTLYSTILTLK